MAPIKKVTGLSEPNSCSASALGGRTANITSAVPKQKIKIVIRNKPDSLVTAGVGRVEESARGKKGADGLPENSGVAQKQSGPELEDDSAVGQDVQQGEGAMNQGAKDASPGALGSGRRSTRTATPKKVWNPNSSLEPSPKQNKAKLEHPDKQIEAPKGGRRKTSTRPTESAPTAKKLKRAQASGGTPNPDSAIESSLSQSSPVSLSPTFSISASDLALAESEPEEVVNAAGILMQMSGDPRGWDPDMMDAEDGEVC